LIWRNPAGARSLHGCIMDHDIIIVGGGPAGLSFARALAGSGLRIAIVERQQRDQLADPGYDGREIALTTGSMRILERMGVWQRIAPDHISPLRAARVINGRSPLALMFDTGARDERELGTLVSNHHIRRALFERVSDQPDVTLLDGTSAATVQARGGHAEVTLASGETLAARLLVAADSRFSAVRDQLGIGAEMKRTGTAMLVCRVAHDRPHDHVAVEWFRDPGTIAMLPLNGDVSSAVLTLEIPEAERLAAMDDDALAQEIAHRFGHRLGAMRLDSSRHVYPLVMTWARQFAIPGAALVGDTAVGMHPVTTHGYNLGLSSADRLAGEIKRAIAGRGDWSADRVLSRYETGHRRHARPIYAGTNMIVGLYGDRRAPAMALRHAGIRVARRLPLFRGAVRNLLLRA
jgi:ubiquinone biosynthesis UbiH/UbiF/VisC/COQ6 family hydroxylase